MTGLRLHILFFIFAAGVSAPLAGQQSAGKVSDTLKTAPSGKQEMSVQQAIEILSRQGGDTLKASEVKKLERQQVKEAKRQATNAKKLEKLQKAEEKKQAKDLKKEEKQRKEVAEYFSHIVTDTTRKPFVADTTNRDPLLDSLAIPNTDYYKKDDSTMVGEALMLKKPPAPKPKSAAHAAFLSAIVPGLGQIYGGSQWWMAPIFWGGMTGTIMAVSYYNNYYNDFRKEYKYRIRTGEVKDYEYFTNEMLVDRMQYAERQRDLWVIGTVGIYLLNVLHANVSVQLNEFRIQKKHRKMLELQNLFEQQPMPSSMTFSPAMIQPNMGVNILPAPGIKLAIDF